MSDTAMYLPLPPKTNLGCCKKSHCPAIIFPELNITILILGRFFDSDDHTHREIEAAVYRRNNPKTFVRQIRIDDIREVKTIKIDSNEVVFNQKARKPLSGLLFAENQSTKLNFQMSEFLRSKNATSKRSQHRHENYECMQTLVISHGYQQDFHWCPLDYMDHSFSLSNLKEI